MKQKVATNPGYILGYHGCDRAFADRVLVGDATITPSRNVYDWLGHGIYFWEDDPTRAMEWAIEKSKHTDASLFEPYVLGAVIDLGACLSLWRRSDFQLIRDGYNTLRSVFQASGEKLPTNSSGKDRLRRELDCAVIQSVHATRERDGLPAFDTVRGMFQEGAEPYPTAGFRERNHIQICVRDPRCIKGYFLPLTESK